MSTTGYGHELDLLNGGRATKTRLATFVERTKSVWRALRNRMASNDLSELDDRQLADIGITRSDVMVALHDSGLLDDPSLLLSNAARNRARTRFSRPARR